MARARVITYWSMPPEPLASARIFGEGAAQMFQIYLREPAIFLGRCDVPWCKARLRHAHSRCLICGSIGFQNNVRCPQCRAVAEPTAIHILADLAERRQ